MARSWACASSHAVDPTAGMSQVSPPMSGLSGGAQQAAVVPMFRLDEIQAAVERVRAAGGSASEPMPEGCGLRAECADDQGVKFHLGQRPRRASSSCVLADLLDELSLRGDEQVLDIGCGPGAVMAMVAKLVPRGHVVALDLSTHNQSDNRPEMTQRNFAAEDVDDRCELKTGDMLAMTVGYKRCACSSRLGGWASLTSGAAPTPATCASAVWKRAAASAGVALLVTTWAWGRPGHSDQTVRCSRLISSGTPGSPRAGHANPPSICRVQSRGVSPNTWRKIRVTDDVENCECADQQRSHPSAYGCPRTSRGWLLGSRRLAQRRPYAGQRLELAGYASAVRLQ
jgi:Methyltransferase domain